MCDHGQQELGSAYAWLEAGGAEGPVELTVAEIVIRARVPLEPLLQRKEQWCQCVESDRPWIIDDDTVTRHTA